MGKSRQAKMHLRFVLVLNKDDLPAETLRVQGIGLSRAEPSRQPTLLGHVGPRSYLLLSLFFYNEKKATKCHMIACLSHYEFTNS